MVAIILCNKLYSLDYDIDKGDYDNRRPIHIASDDNSYKAVYALLQYGANYRLMDRWQQSLLTKIITKKDNKIASCFLLHFKVRILKYNAFEKFKTIVNT